MNLNDGNMIVYESLLEEENYIKQRAREAWKSESLELDERWEIYNKYGELKHYNVEFDIDILNDAVHDLEFNRYEVICIDDLVDNVYDIAHKNLKRKYDIVDSCYFEKVLDRLTVMLKKKILKELDYNSYTYDW